MKDAIDSTAPNAGPGNGQEGFTNRKLIRPSLNTPSVRTEAAPDRRDRGDRGDRVQPVRRMAAPDQTHAENFYYQKQMQSKTPVVVVLKDGEQLQGLIEWYDKYCIKLTRNGGGALVVYKPAIRYIFKAGENSSQS